MQFVIDSHFRSPTDWSEWQDDWCNHNRKVATGDSKHAWK